MSILSEKERKEVFERHTKSMLLLNEIYTYLDKNLIKETEKACQKKVFYEIDGEIKAGSGEDQFSRGWRCGLETLKKELNLEEKEVK